jgi:hypothetical protein
LRVDYRVYPIKDPPPGCSDRLWLPVLAVSIIYRHAESRRLEAIVDSGSPFCLFHADIGRGLGMEVESGAGRELGGVIGGVRRKTYYHMVKLKLAGTIIPVVAGFCPELSVGAILGRMGFFDNYRITFNPEYTPPGMEIEKVNRA